MKGFQLLVWHVENLKILTPILITKKQAKSTENQQLFLDPTDNQASREITSLPQTRETSQYQEQKLLL